MLYDSANRVLMARVSGTFTVADLTRLNADARAFAAERGTVRFICDLTDVEDVKIPASLLAYRAQMVPAQPAARRVYVAPTPLLFGLCRMYATHLRLAGDPEPTIVESLNEAFRVLDLTKPVFESLQEVTQNLEELPAFNGNYAQPI